jgi:hypothetical protein
MLHYQIMVNIYSEFKENYATIRQKEVIIMFCHVYGHISKQVSLACPFDSIYDFDKMKKICSNTCQGNSILSNYV